MLENIEKAHIRSMHYLELKQSTREKNVLRAKIQVLLEGMLVAHWILFVVPCWWNLLKICPLECFRSLTSGMPRKVSQESVLLETLYCEITQGGWWGKLSATD